MSTRSIVTVVGGVIGAYFGYPQLGLTLGALVGSAVDPGKIQGPQINETGSQTSAEGVPRPIIWGAIDVSGNIIQKGSLVKVTTEESQGKGGGPEVETTRAYRTYAIRICEGPIAAILRIWADNKLVYDMRTGSGMIPESQAWIANKVVYLGDETQTPDPTLVASVNSDTPSYRGTAYIVFILEDLTDRAGSIAQYRFEVAKEIVSSVGESHQGPTQLLGTYLDVGADGDPFMIGDQTNGGGRIFEVGSPGSYDVLVYDAEDFTTTSSSISGTTISNAGDTPGDQRLWPIASDNEGYAISYDGNFGGCKLVFNGALKAILKPEVGASDGWWFNEASYFPEYGGLVWFYGNFIYLGARMTGSTGTAWNRIMKFPKQAATGTQYPLATAASISSSVSSPVFWMHVSRTGIVRAIDSQDFTTVQQYDADLNAIASATVPASVQSAISAGAVFRAFAFDESKGMQVYAYWKNTPSGLYVDIFDLAGSLIAANSFATASNNVCHRLVFSDVNIFVQNWVNSFVISIPPTGSGVPAILGDIVSDIHQRCGLDSSFYDVSELTDEVAGFVCAGDYTGSDAINTLRQGYFFDKSEHDKKLWYPKRGAAVIETLTVDDLTEIPDTTKREQAIEVPKKFHLRYKHAASGYAAVKATSSSSSQDMLTTGEVSIDLPVVLNEDQAAQKADVMYKITRTEIYGETEITVPMDVGAKYVTGNTIGLSLRGQTTRQRIDGIDFADWKLKLRLKPDRQSAYTSNLTGVPIPEPELPPSTIVGDTEIAILDISARIDSEDDLNYYVAVSGRLPPWYGARYQRSLDGGASYVTVQDITTASVMGEITNSVTDASEFFTDEFNTVNVILYRDSQSIESITNTQFLAEGGAFVLEKSDGSWEIMQYMDAVEESDGSFTLSTLHRGMLNSGTSTHVAGDRLVMLSRPSHIVAQSSFLNTDLTHRAISLGESADDTDNDFTDTYIGRSQREWPVEFLQVEEDSAGSISANWVPRFRFGTDANPVNSINMIGYRVTIDDGSSSLTFDTTVPNFSNYDASSLGETKTVTIAALNRITGPGEEVSTVV